MENRLLDIEIPSKKKNNLTKEERNALYSLRDDSTIITKGANKGSVVVVQYGEDDLKEPYKQLEHREVYEVVRNDLNVLVNTIIKALEKIPFCGDLSSDTLHYFVVEDPQFARFYL